MGGSRVSRTSCHLLTAQVLSSDTLRVSRSDLGTNRYDSHEQVYAISSTLQDLLIKGMVLKGGHGSWLQTAPVLGRAQGDSCLTET